jgi:dihydropteroate synthase
MKGNPSNMLKKAKYDDIIGELISYFSKKINDAAKFNIKDVIIDPGFGFAKNISQNFELLNNLDFFKNLKMPLLVGLSRKSMIYKTLNIKPDKALNGSTVLHAISLIKGANILRVHDVKEAVECIKLIEELKKN